MLGNGLRVIAVSISASKWKSTSMTQHYVKSINAIGVLPSGCYRKCIDDVVAFPKPLTSPGIIYSGIWLYCTEQSESCLHHLWITTDSSPVAINFHYHVISHFKIWLNPEHMKDKHLFPYEKNLGAQIYQWKIEDQSLQQQAITKVIKVYIVIQIVIKQIT